MQIWTTIVNSNAFNFIILLALIIYAIKALNVKSMLANAQDKVKETVETSNKTKEDSISQLNKAQETVKNIANEVRAIFEAAQNSIDYSAKKIINNANDEVKKITANAQKIIENETKKETVSLSKKAALISIELAKGHIIDTINAKPEYHNIFIQKSIAELNRLEINEQH